MEYRDSNQQQLHDDGVDNETYIVQIFSTFAPPEAKPLLLRLEAGDKVTDLVVKAMEKFQALQTIVILPSNEPNDYVVSAAGGDGMPLPTVPPFRPDTVVRSCGLEFPYMLSLNHHEELQIIQEYARQAAAQEAAIGSAENQQNSDAVTSSVGKALLAAERDARAAHTAKVEEIREQRVREIEKRQAEKEKKHFQHCESYELYRQEAQAQERQKQKEKLQRAETQAQAASLRDEVEAERNKPKEQRLLEEHRQRMEAQLAAEKERLERMKQQQEEAAAEAEEKKRRIAQELAAKRKAEQGQRLNSLFDRLMDNLSGQMERERLDEDSRIESERQRRRDEERAVMELRRVEHLEKSRAIQKEAERARRCREEREAADRTAKLEQTRIDELDRERQEEEQRYQEWKNRRKQQMDVVESELELHYRSQISNTSTNTTQQTIQQA